MKTRLRRRYGHTSEKLGSAQIKALITFVKPGGHGFARYPHNGRAMARVLYNKGLIEVGSAPRRCSGARGGYQLLGVLTQAGLDALSVIGMRAFSAENSSLTRKLPGWKTWSAADAKVLWEDSSITGLTPEQ